MNIIYMGEFTFYVFLFIVAFVVAFIGGYIGAIIGRLIGAWRRHKKIEDDNKVY